jgi:UDP-N-acetylglucosamine acyltransferase
MPILVADTAWVDPSARLEDGAEIGPFCIVGPGTSIGRDTRLAGHVCIHAGTILGASNIIHPFCVLGAEPPARRDQPSPEPPLVVRDHNTFHEGVIISRGLSTTAGPTRIGSHNLFAAGAQVGPSSFVADHAVISSAALLGPSVHVLSHAMLSPAVIVHHDVTIGEQSFVGPQSRILHDVPPFMLVDGHPARVRSINITRLKRQGLHPTEIEALHEAHRLVFRARMSLARARETLFAHGHVSPAVERLCAFLEAQEQGRHGRARDRQYHNAPQSGLHEATA